MKLFLLSAVLILSSEQAHAGWSHEVLKFNAYAANSINSTHSDYPNVYAGGDINLSHFTVFGYAEAAGKYSHLSGGYVKQVGAQKIHLQSPQVNSSSVKKLALSFLEQRRSQFANEVQLISTRIAGLARTSSAQVVNSVLVIRALVGTVTVVDLTTADLEQNISIEGDSNSLIVIRVSGCQLKLYGRRTNLMGVSPNQVLFYSSSVKTARLMDSGPSKEQALNGLMGSWILPHANVDFSRALIVGNLVTASISTSVAHSGQINPGCFQGLNSIGVGCEGPQLSLLNHQQQITPPPCGVCVCPEGVTQIGTTSSH